MLIAAVNECQIHRQIRDERYSVIRMMAFMWRCRGELCQVAGACPTPQDHRVALIVDQSMRVDLIYSPEQNSFEDAQRDGRWHSKRP